MSLATREDDPLGEGAALVATLCYMCSSECGLLVSEKAGKVRIKGNPAHPVNRGKICPKIKSALSLLYSPSRILSPKKRVGARGEGKFIDISWQQAFRDIATKLEAVREQYCSEALTMLFGEKPDHDVAYWFAFLYGTPNILDHNSLCDTSKRLAYKSVFGEGQERPLPDLQRPAWTNLGYREKHDCRLLILVGENPAEAIRYFWFWQGICEAKRQGMTLVVVDPYQTKTAKLADLWLPIRPGTDVCLLLYLLKNVVDSGAYDREFVDVHVSDFTNMQHELSVPVLDAGLTRYSLEWVAHMTGLEQQYLQRLSALVCTENPLLISVGKNGVAHQYSGFCTTRLAAIITALSGSLDVPGGLLLRDPPRYKSLSNSSDLLRAGQADKHKDYSGRFPLASHGVVSTIPSEILDGVTIMEGPCKGHQYQTKALIVTHGNPLLTAPDSAQWRKAMTARSGDGYQLSLLVVNDSVLHDTALYADYLLPMRHFLERQGVTEQESAIPLTGLRQMAVTPPATTRSPLEIYQGLAQAFDSSDGFAPLLALTGDDDWCDRTLGKAGETAELRMQGGVQARPIRYRKFTTQGFATPTTKVELYPHGAKTLAEQAYYRNEASCYAQASSKARFRLITGRVLGHVHSLTPLLDGASASPYVWLNNVDAQAKGIKTGDLVKLDVEGKASLIARAKVSLVLRQGVVRALYGWGSALSSTPHNYNINELIDSRHLHPISGNAVFGAVWVTINKLI
ncbi:putative molybdopterin oxidoreductase [Photobacterium gaetbulicola Gung47]|uniref:Putative molybdopterin oxidoreductase n=1 Tax=Photobacterium gaetbulicola Gung47 TaxID=658445 RepID=A0A0C5X1J9_9GAMM|nr:molybdopterin-dependent oxidoreductase [Photobacterium gaetbulicola]AJR09195.1 putative molybdopterin oxidoreductase [Photobacterium gaetbulicola Gung47]